MAWATRHRDSRPLRMSPSLRLPPSQSCPSTCSTLNATLGTVSALDCDGGVCIVPAGPKPSSVLSPAVGFDSSYTGLLKLRPVVAVVPLATTLVDDWFELLLLCAGGVADKMPYFVAELSSTMSDWKKRRVRVASGRRIPSTYQHAILVGTQNDLRAGLHVVPHERRVDCGRVQDVAQRDIGGWGQKEDDRREFGAGNDQFDGDARRGNQQTRQACKQNEIEITNCRLRRHLRHSLSPAMTACVYFFGNMLANP